MKIKFKKARQFASDDSMIGVRRAAADTQKTLQPLDLAIHRKSDTAKLLDKPNLTGPLPEKPGTQAINTGMTDSAGPLAQARGLLGQSPMAAKMILSSVQRATGAAPDYKVDLTAAVAAQLRIEEMDESPAPLGAIGLSMNHRDGLSLSIERLDCLLDAVTSAGHFLLNIKEPNLRQRFINANSAPDPGEIRTADEQESAVRQAHEALEQRCKGMRDNVTFFYREAVDLVYDVSRGLEAATFEATANGMLQSQVPLSPAQHAKIAADQRAMQWPPLQYFLPKFFSEYAETYISPAGGMLAIHAWRNTMLERTHKVTAPLAGL